MFDRFRHKDGTTAPLDRKKLEAWQNSHSTSSTATATARGVSGGNNQYRYAVKGGPPPKRPPRPREIDLPPEDINSVPLQGSGYLSPPVQTFPTGRKSERDSFHGRPVSSIYSQPSPEASVFAAHQLKNDMAYHGPLEISPPSSPDVASPRRGPFPGDVSPIEEAPEPPPVPQERKTMATKTETRTNIPMMRRERRKNSDAALNTLREAKSRERLTSTPPRPYNHDVRWDPSTGEPTTSTKGRPASVKPQEYAHGLTNRGDARPPSSGRGPIGLPPNPAALRDRLRPVRPASTNPQPAPAQRPEWNGASGRTSIVPPVKDNKNVTPLRIPPRTGKMASQGRPMLSPIESNGSGAATSPSSSVQQTHSPVVATDSPSRPSGYPTPPPSEDPVRAKPPTAQPAVQPRLRIPSNEQATRRKPTRPAPGQNPESPSPSEHVHRKAQPQAIPVRGSSRASAQPASRINVAKNANRKHITPRASSEDLSPAPTPPQLSTPTPTAKPTPEVSVLSRGRPTVSGYESSPTTTPIEAVTVKIHLDSPYYTTANTSSANTPSSGTKPHPSEPRVFTTRVVPDLDGNQSASSISSGVSHDKSLPPAPPEVSAKDRVTELNAQLEALGNRRININTAIRQMTEMMPTDNILASEAVVRKREREKKKVEHLRTELADVERQSYELGLKLHRAYKRLDRDAEYEPTTLWVRRITH